MMLVSHNSVSLILTSFSKEFIATCSDKVETPIHDSIRELVTWECKEHGVKS